MKKIFFLFLFILFITTHTNINAADLNIVCDDSGCTPPSSSSIFSSEPWFPLKKETKTIYLLNNSPNSQLIGLSVTNGTTGSTDLSNVMTMKITDNFLNNLYDDSLTNFYTLSEYPLTFLINSGHDVTYSFQASMNDVGNDWQERDTSFDMTIGFVIIPTQTPAPTNTPAPGPTNTPGPGPTSTPTPVPVPGSFIPFNFSGQIINVPVLGAQTSVTPTPTKTIAEKILATTKNTGKTLGARTNPWWWWILFIIQIILESTILKKTNKDIKKRILFAQFISGILFGFIFSKYPSSLISLIISVVISLLFFIATYKKARV